MNDQCDAETLAIGPIPYTAEIGSDTEDFSTKQKGSGSGIEVAKC